jgi:hypothetical protein
VSFSFYLLFPVDRPIARKDIAEFVRDGSYFDEPVAYEPSIQGDLGELTIKYAPQRSIRLQHLDRENNEEIIEEALESLDSASIPAERREQLRKRLTETKAMVEIQADRTTMDQNAWAMLDALEADLMRSNNGLLYVYDEGIYGPDLKLWPEVV